MSVREQDLHHESRRTPAPTGDQIAAEVHDHVGQTDTNLSKVAAMLTDAHAHRPGVWQQDLAKVNKALHENGVLTNMEIVGVQGRDFAVRDQEGRVKLVDSSNTNYSYDRNGNLDNQFGRNKGTFESNSDGSGKYTVSAKDNGWSIAHDILKSQGVEHPTANQQANYLKELAQANPHKDLAKLHVGEQLTIPASTNKLDSTTVLDSGIPKSSALEGDRLSVVAGYNAGTAALAKYSGGGGFQSHMNADQINSALSNPDTPAADKPGLQFLSRNYEALKGSGILYGDSITQESLDAWKLTQARHIGERVNSEYHEYFDRR